MRFALIGAAGFVAPRHMAAIQAVGGELVAALDPSDSVGILDSYSRECETFTDDYRFERYLSQHPVDYVVVCSPNYMHDFHCRMALRNGAHVICEKPLCLEPRNLDAIQLVESETGRRVYPLLQLRVHPALLQLKEEWKPGQVAHRFGLRYVTPRGRWYARSWKGDVEKSGGILTNLGVHLIDALVWVFGTPTANYLRSRQDTYANGTLGFDGAWVDWVLSTDPDDVPDRQLYSEDRQEVVADFTKNFHEYHLEVYRKVLADDWIGTEDARAAIEICAELRGKSPL